MEAPPPMWLLTTMSRDTYRKPIWGAWLLITIGALFNYHYNYHRHNIRLTMPTVSDEIGRDVIATINIGVIMIVTAISHLLPLEWLGEKCCSNPLDYNPMRNARFHIDALMYGIMIFFLSGGNTIEELVCWCIILSISASALGSYRYSVITSIQSYWEMLCIMQDMPNEMKEKTKGQNIVQKVTAVLRNSGGVADGLKNIQAELMKPAAPTRTSESHTASLLNQSNDSADNDGSSSVKRSGSMELHSVSLTRDNDGDSKREESEQLTSSSSSSSSPPQPSSTSSSSDKTVPLIGVSVSKVSDDDDGIDNDDNDEIEIDLEDDKTSATTSAPAKNAIPYPMIPRVDKKNRTFSSFIVHSMKWVAIKTFAAICLSAIIHLAFTVDPFKVDTKIVVAAFSTVVAGVMQIVFIYFSVNVGELLEALVNYRPYMEPQKPNVMSINTQTVCSLISGTCLLLSSVLSKYN